MKLISLNLGKEQTLQRKDRVERTGIFKIPTSESLWLSSLGFENDAILSKKHHGGPDQAVYIYGAADYDWWSKELGKELAPGTFGDNLTISDLESAQFDIGDYLYIGAVALQVTAPRIPCSTFAARMEDPQWVKKFRYAERPGLYCRVLQEGFVQAGSPVTVERYAGETLPVLQMFREYYDRNKSEVTLRRHLNAPIAIRARVDLEEELQNLLAQR
jgi:MOSC domain-containing protein YiiM